MTYEYRTPGRDWRTLLINEGASFADVFRALGPGAEVRCVYVAARWQDNTTATGAALVGSVGARLRDLEHKWMTLSERVADAEESLARARAGSLEALEARISQIEALREMGVRTW